MNPESEIFSWARQMLFELGYQTEHNPQLIKDVPWSTIYSFHTSKDRIFLKTMAGPFAIEPTLLTFLFENVTKQVPEVIATNPHLRCFLMNDAGMCLRDILKNNFDEKYFCSIFQIYTDIQIDCIPYIDELIAAGLNDWRLKNLPTLFQNFLNKNELLMNDGLSQKEIENLKNLLPDLINICDLLADYKIPETLEHRDFHDNNVLIKGQNIVINDWGDACISHPFFSFLSFFDSAKRHHKIYEEDEIYKNVQSAFLSKWHAYGNEPALSEALILAKKIKPIIFTLSFSRIFSCPDAHLYPEYRGYMTEALRDFIKRIN
ncbi:MAG: aminoglycoside phosphotransferase family protein [Alphaproteobacteria bacterium]|nr:aminoglycoside phosphotransferase family protein [Alphaproteobacteria bacterium]